MKDSKFGAVTLTFLVVANMIGVGVFTTSGFAISDLHSPFLVICAWLVGGVLAIAGAFSYGQLVQHIPESGGEYVFLSRAAHPYLGFLAGWVSLIAGFSGAIAAAATGFEFYAIPNQIRPAFVPQGSVAVASIVFAAICHGLNVRAGSVIQNLGVLLKMVALTFFIGFAISKLGLPIWEGVKYESQSSSFSSVASAFAGTVVWISFSYMGFNAAVYLVEEAKRPRIDVPRALVLGTSMVTILYILLNAIFVYAPSMDAIEGQEEIAAIVARHLGGSILENFVRCIIAGALLTSVTSMMMAAPRVYSKMADDGVFPSWMKSNHQVSTMAIIIQVGIAIAIAMSASLIAQLKYLGLTLSLSAMISVCCLFLPRVRNGRKLNFRDAAPLVYVLGTSISCAILVIRDRRYSYGTLITIAVGSIMYFAFRSSAVTKRAS